MPPRECYLCGHHEEAALKDHYVIPATEGGRKDPSNIVTLCSNCDEFITAMDEKLKSDIISWLRSGIKRSFEDHLNFQTLPPKARHLVREHLNDWLRRLESI